MGQRDTNRLSGYNARPLADQRATSKVRLLEPYTLRLHFRLYGPSTMRLNPSCYMCCPCWLHADARTLVMHPGLEPRVSGSGRRSPIRHATLPMKRYASSTVFHTCGNEIRGMGVTATTNLRCRGPSPIPNISGIGPTGLAKDEPCRATYMCRDLAL